MGYLADGHHNERIIMDRMRLGDTQRATYVRRNAILSTFPDDRLDQMQHDVERLMLRLESHVLAHQIATHRERHLVATDTWVFPTSPWQFFKRRHEESWWLGWLVRRRPVRTEATTRRYERFVTIARNVTFPECQRQFPDDFGRPVMVDVVEVGDQITSDRSER